MKRLRDWLELCRIPNVFTAVADPLAGALLVGAGWRDLPLVLLVMLASACIYTGGIILNDWNDYRQDLKERPERPLPSRRIRRISALAVATTFLVLGPGLTSPFGIELNQWTVLLVIAVVVYDVLLKHTPLAPAVMGLCRGLNLLLGMIAALPADSPVPPRMRMYVFFVMWAYVLGLTLFARHEAKGRHKWLLLSGALTTWAAVIAAALLPTLFSAARYHVGLAWCAALLAATGYRMAQGLVAPTPERIQAAVRTAIFGIVLLDASFVAFTRDMLISVPVALLLLPTVWLGRRLYST